MPQKVQFPIHVSKATICPKTVLAFKKIKHETTLKIISIMAAKPPPAPNTSPLITLGVTGVAKPDACREAPAGALFRVKNHVISAITNIKATAA